MSTVMDMLSWLPWLAGGGLGAGALGLLAVAVLGGLPAALKIVQSIVEMVAPLGRGAAEGVVALVQMFFRGIKVCLTNTETFVVMFVVLVAGGYWLGGISPQARSDAKSVTVLQGELRKAKTAAKHKPTNKQQASPPRPIWPFW